MSSALIRSPQNPNAQQVPPGIVARVSGAIKAGLAAASDAWNGWFAPGVPPTAAVDTPIRTFEFPVGSNIAQQIPKSGEGISYSMLAAFSYNYDILRLAIETRKDQAAKLKWSIRLADDEADPDPATQARIDALTIFFRHPDQVHDWTTWLRMLLENLFVYDAPVVYRRPTIMGIDGNGRTLPPTASTTFALEVIDGTTIKRMVDNTGRTPLPPLEAYRQFLYGVPVRPPSGPLTTDDIVFAPRNQLPKRMYGYSPVEQIITTVNIGLRRLSQQLSFFTDGTMPEGFIQGDQNWTASEISQFQASFDAYYAGNQQARSRLAVIPHGAVPIFPKVASLFDQFDELLIRTVMYAFSLPPTPFIKQMNRATATTAQEVALEEGLQPIMAYLTASVMDPILAKWFDSPDLTFDWEFGIDVDAEAQARIDEIYVRTGVLSIDEVRERMGRDPIGVGPGVITMNGFTPLYATPAVPVEKPPEPAPAPAPPPGKKPPGDGGGNGAVKSSDPYRHEGFHALNKRLSDLERR